MLAQAAEANDLAQIKIAREFVELVSLITNECKWMICFGEQDPLTGHCVELHDCGLTWTNMPQILTDQTIQRIVTDYEQNSTAPNKPNILSLLGVVNKEKAIKLESLSWCSSRSRQANSTIE